MFIIGSLNCFEAGDAFIFEYQDGVGFSWSLPAKPASRQTTRARFLFPPWRG